MFLPEAEIGCLQAVWTQGDGLKPWVLGNATGILRDFGTSPHHLIKQPWLLRNL
jgi:hypothetical protein